MGTVKGSRQEKMVVVPYRPWRQRFFAVWVSAAIALAAAIGAALGHSHATRDQAALHSEASRVQQELERTQHELEEIRSGYVLMDRSRMVDQRASEEALATISQLRTRMAQLEQDVLFYRQVMVPDAEYTGLVLAQAEIAPANQPGSYRYRIAFRQHGQQGKALDGKASIKIKGMLDGQAHVYELSELSDAVTDPVIPLGFLYFQNLDGELEIPTGFTPESIEIRASSVRPVVKQIEKIVKWSEAGEH
jgi:hypothetical protein